MDSTSYYTYTRFLHSKGFDHIDDQEFCPLVLSDYPSVNVIPVSSNANTTITTNSTTNSINSAVTTPNTSISSDVIINSSLNNHNPPSQHFTPRAKKILEIVNPHTGLRIASPSAKPV